MSREFSLSVGKVRKDVACNVRMVGPADAETQPRKVPRSEPRLQRTQSIVSSESTSHLEAETAQGHFEFIVDRKKFRGLDLKEAHQSCHRVA